VPTPSRPELAEADDFAFAMLARLTIPEEMAARKFEAKPTLAAPAAVTVLEQKVVAGLAAAVLEASDARALEGWLKQNGYPTSAELVEWVAPYIAAKWKITAFKIAGDAQKVTSAAVRMSFQAEKPFFPYREPAAQGAAGKSGDRLLRVYFLADARFAGAIGDKAPWAGQAVWSNNIGKEQVGRLLKLAKLPVLAGGGGQWLTVFEDRSSPRPGTDEVFFARAADQSTIARPVDSPIAAITSNRTVRVVAIAALVAALIIVAFVVYRRRRGGRRHFG
jgi:hypothetical protein